MQEINICDRKMSVGLEWEIIPGDIEKIDREMREIAQKNGCRFGMTFNYEDTVSAAFSLKKFSSAPGALFLAFAHQAFLREIDRDDPNIKKDWMYLDKDEEAGKYWFCVIKDGIPTPGFDLVVEELSQLSEKLQELMRVDTYLVYSPLAEAENYFNTLGFMSPEKRNFEDLTEGIDLKKIQKTKAKFKKLVGIPSHWMALGIALIVIIIGAYLYDDWATAEKKKKAALARTKNLMVAKSKEEEAYKQAVKNYYIEFYKVRKAAFDKVLPVVAYNSEQISNQWLDVADFKFASHGWRLGSIKCEFDEKAKSDSEKAICTKKFTKGNYATNKMLFDDEPDAVLASPTASEAKVEIKLPVLRTQADLSTYPFMDMSTFAIDFLSLMQTYKNSGLGFQTSKKGEEIIFKPPNVPLTKEQKDSKVKVRPPDNLKIGFAKGNFTLKGDGLESFKEAFKIVGWNSFALNSVEFTISEGLKLSWIAQIDYIVKTNADNLEPPIIANMSPESLGVSDK